LERWGLNCKLQKKTLNVSLLINIMCGHVEMFKELVVTWNVRNCGIMIHCILLVLRWSYLQDLNTKCDHTLQIGVMCGITLVVKPRPRIWVFFQVLQTITN
jgi:hypothetical protein